MTRPEMTRPQAPGPQGVVSQPVGVEGAGPGVGGPEVVEAQPVGAAGLIASPAWSRLGVIFRLLMLLRVLLLAMAVVLTPVRKLDLDVLAAIAVLAVVSGVVSWAWRGVLPALLRHPALCCLDALLVFAVQALGGVDGPFFLFTVMTSAIAGVLYEWAALLVICVVQITLCYVAVGGLLGGAGAEPQMMIGLPIFYPIAACAGVALRHLFDQYAEAEEARRGAEAVAAAMEERSRLAREMHDSLAKTLQGVALTAATLPVWIRKSPERAERDAKQIATSLQIASREARVLISDLRDDALGLPLSVAVGQAVAEWSRSSGIPARVHIPGVVDVPMNVKHESLLVVKEALRNVSRHAAARSVEVQVTSTAERIELSVRDDGRGFALPPDGRLELLARHGHYGVVGMWERARRAGGRLGVAAAPGQGTKITLTLPRPAALPAAPYSEVNG